MFSSKFFIVVGIFFSTFSSSSFSLDSISHSSACNLYIEEGVNKRIGFPHIDDTIIDILQSKGFNLIFTKTEKRLDLAKGCGEQGLTLKFTYWQNGSDAHLVLFVGIGRFSIKTKPDPCRFRERHSCEFPEWFVRWMCGSSFEEKPEQYLVLYPRWEFRDEIQMSVTAKDPSDFFTILVQDGEFSVAERLSPNHFLVNLSDDEIDAIENELHEQKVHYQKSMQSIFEKIPSYQCIIEYETPPEH